MKVALWAEIRRLSEIEKLSGRVIARRLHCSRDTVAAALEMQQPPSSQTIPRASVLDPYLDRIKELLAQYPDLSAVRIREEIARGPEGYTGSAITLRRYLRKVRPARGRVYQEVHYEPAQAMQVDWGECGRVQVGATTRKVSVFVAVLCYSRLLYIEFTPQFIFLLPLHFSSFFLLCVRRHEGEAFHPPAFGVTIQAHALGHPRQPNDKVLVRHFGQMRPFGFRQRDHHAAVGSRQFLAT